MAEAVFKDAILTIAMDIGTRYSGYAFNFKGMDQEVYVCTEYAESVGTTMAYKAPTCVLLQGDGSFLAFGYDASTMYLEEDDKDAMFFENFKMVLYESEVEGKELDVEGAKIRARNGKEHSALDVFAHAMTFFRDHSITYIEDTTGIKVDLQKVLWVITVPAIWSNRAKFFMRKAAYKAGIVTEEQSNRLLIALEPEVAALHCRELAVRQFTDFSTQGVEGGKLDREFDKMDPGAKFCVIDAGGGTVDITAQEIFADNGVKQLARACGGPHGGAEVDSEFEKLLESIFGSSFIKDFEETEPIAYQDLLLGFERNKRGYSLTEKRPRLNVKLPRKFCRNFEKETNTSVEEAVASFKKDTGKHVDVKDEDLLRINRPTLDDALFKPVINDVISALDGFLSRKETQDISIFFIVGGFGKSISKGVREYILAKDPNARIRVPKDPGLAVLKGAVLFGTDPSIIRERTAELTYGLRIAPLFREGYHEPAKKVTVEGRAYCQDVFQALIREGQKVKYGHVEHHSFANVDKDSDSFTAVIYSTSETLEARKVVYIDQNCRRIGSITVDVTAFGNDAVRVTFCVGGTELRVTAINVRTNKKAVTAVEFNSHA